MTEHSNEEKKKSARVEFFSDGVFSIAITLLVLELIHTLDSKDSTLVTGLLKNWHSFLAFIIGFVTILVCWINHHVAFEYIDKVDTKFLWVNGFLLFIVTLAPFSTAVVAEYLQTESSKALAVFGVNYILISIAAYSICYYALRHHLVPEEKREFFYSYSHIYRYGIYFTIFALFVCFLSVWVAILLYLILFFLFAAPKELTLRVEIIRKKKFKKSKPGKSKHKGESIND